MKAKYAKTLALIFSRPASGNVRWSDAEALLASLGAEISEGEGSRVRVRLFTKGFDNSGFAEAGEGSRVRVRLFGDRRVFHRPHPSPSMDKGAVVSLREWLEANGVIP